MQRSRRLAAAQADSRVLVTQDLDFSDVRAFAPGTHSGVVLVRLPEADQWQLADFVVACFALDDSRSWAGCFVVLTPAEVRVLRPPTEL